MSAVENRMSSMCGKYHKIAEKRTFADRFECFGCGLDVPQNGPNSKNLESGKKLPACYFSLKSR